MRVTLALMCLVAGCSTVPHVPENVVENMPTVNIDETGEEPLTPVAAKFDKPIPYQIEACKAAIGVIMGREPKTMKGKFVADLAHISYIRPDDGKRWQARCRADGTNRITWAAFDAFGDGQQGRWREEESINFEVKGKTLAVTINQFGEPETGEFPLSELK